MMYEESYCVRCICCHKRDWSLVKEWHFWSIIFLTTCVPRSGFLNAKTLAHILVRIANCANHLCSFPGNPLQQVWLTPFSIRTENRANDKAWSGPMFMINYSYLKKPNFCLQEGLEAGSYPSLPHQFSGWSPLWAHHPTHRPLPHHQCQHRTPRRLHPHHQLYLHRVHLTNRRVDISISRPFMGTNRRSTKKNCQTSSDQ